MESTEIKSFNSADMDRQCFKIKKNVNFPLPINEVASLDSVCGGINLTLPADTRISKRCAGPSRSPRRQRSADSSLETRAPQPCWSNSSTLHLLLNPAAPPPQPCSSSSTLHFQPFLPSPPSFLLHHLSILSPQTQNVMYDLVSELQERGEELDKRIGKLEEKLDAIGVSLQGLPGLLSQAILQQQRDFLKSLAHRAVQQRPGSQGSEPSWTPTRQRRRSPSTAPHTSSDSG